MYLQTMELKYDLNLPVNFNHCFFLSMLADYVQQYNAPSIRPAVQQTYRGTPPPSRRPTENYTPRPVTHDDYDDALIQGQVCLYSIENINN